MYMIAISTCLGLFAANFHWSRMLSLIFSCLILNCHGTFIFSQTLNIFICGIFKHNLCAAAKKFISFDIWSSTTSAETKSLLPKPSAHWNTEHYCGWADNDDVDLESDINRLASGNLQWYTTIPSQYEQLCWTWMWRLIYFESWSHYNKSPGSV